MAKIGLLITKLNGGGAERTAANLSSLFDEYGEEVYLITFDGSNITYPYKGKLIDLSLGINKNVFDAIKKNIKNAPCPGSIPVGCIIFVLDARAVGGWAPPPAQRQAPYPWRSVRFVQHKQRLDSVGPTTGIAWRSRSRCRAAGAR